MALQPLLRKLGSTFRPALLGAAVCFVSTSIFANPVLNNVSHGQATVQQSGNNTTINQTSQNAIINWRSFNIGAQSHTHFQQPTGGVALNRIDPTQGASEIYGRLTATGKVILVNPAGIYFGPSAYVNVGGLIASTANISDQDFLNGYYRFTNDPNFRGAITNQGQLIAADNGLIALIGGAVRNDGMIQANMGHAILASGNAFTISLAGNDLIHFSVDEEVTGRAVDHQGNEISNGIRNTGTIVANGGRVLVSAKAASGVLDHVINMSGKVEARGVYQNGGTIVLSANPSAGKVRVAAKLDVSADQPGQTGGVIEITGNNIEIASGAEIDASGDSGGGRVNIGGNYLGHGPLPNASTVLMEDDASIAADAYRSGSGGRVIVWSDDYTEVSGNIQVRGGSESGDGGFIETSGKYVLKVGDLSIDTTAANGETGTWLLDPTSIYIADNQTNATTAGMVTLDNSASTEVGGTFAATNDVIDSFLSVTNLEAGLAGANIIVTTDNAQPGAAQGHIFVVDDINWSSGNSLTLVANNDIMLQAGIYGVNGSLNLDAGNQVIPNANAHVDVNNFHLQSGEWIQVFGTLPTFNVRNNFQLNNGVLGSGSDVVFVRATSGGEVPHTIVDIYGLQGAASDLDRDYRLGNDIDASVTRNWSGSREGFVSIGDDTDKFTRDFDGQGYTVDGLYINEPSTDHIGLFGHTSATAEVGDINLTNVDITGDFNVGGLVGTNQGEVTNSSSSGSVTGTSRVGGLVGWNDGSTEARVASSHTSGNVTATGGAELDANVGGLVGLSGYFVGWNGNTAMVDGSFSDATVVGNEISSGGLIGQQRYGSMLRNSYFSGSVSGTDNVGGLVGSNVNGGMIETSYNAGSVTGDENVGGIAGRMAFGAPNEDSSSILSVYNIGSVSGNENVGGIVGENRSIIEESYNTGAVSGQQNVGGLVGDNSDGELYTSALDIRTSGQTELVGDSGDEEDNFSGTFDGSTGRNLSSYDTYDEDLSWDIASLNGGLAESTWLILDGETRPFLEMEHSTTIRNAHQLQLIVVDRNEDYVLANDIDLTSAFSNEADIWGTNRNLAQTTGTGFDPIGGEQLESFEGTFDGQGYNIDALYITGTTSEASNTNFGLFGYSYGDISNVNLRNASITITNSNSSGDGCGIGSCNGDGILAGFSGGSITNVSVSGSISTIGSKLGGLVGVNYGDIEDSYSTASVTGAQAAYVGGLVGANAGLINATYQGVIERSYSSGDVTIVTNSSAIGVGGFVGAQAGIIRDSYTTSNVSGARSDNIGGFAGKIDRNFTNFMNSDTQPLVERTYSSGTVTGTDTGSNYIGGFAGDNDQTELEVDNVRDSFWDTDSSGLSNAVGRNASNGITGGCFGGSCSNGGTVDLSARSTYSAEGTDWDISNTPSTSAAAPSGDWFIFEGGTRPMLLMEHSETVTNTHQLQLIGAALGGDYVIANDIDFTERAFSDTSAVWGTSGNPLVGEGWIPIGTFATPFTGTLDGQEYEVSGLRARTVPDGTPLGMFGVVADGAAVNNLYLSVSFDTSSNGSALYVGGLAAVTTGTPTFDNIHVSGIVSGQGTPGMVHAGGIFGELTGNITNSSSNVFVGTNGHAGGIAGISSGSIATSYAAGSVFSISSPTQNLGGLVGDNSGSITDAYNIGSVSSVNAAYTGGIGGIAGANTGTITNTYNSGNVSATSVGAVEGGLVGDNTGGTIANSFWDTDTALQTTAVGAGPAGNSTGGCFDGTCSNGGTANLGRLSTYDEEGIEWNIENDPSNANIADATWFIFTNGADDTGYTRPMLMMENTANIRNAHQLQMMGAIVDGDYQLMNDINLEAPLANASDVWGGNARGFARIGNDAFSSFQGTFDGQNHTISSLSQDLSGELIGGLFASLENATVSNLNFENASITAGDVSGILAGLTDSSTIRNINVSNSTLTGHDTNIQFGVYGGVIGLALGGNLSDMTITNSTVTGYENVGGIVGAAAEGVALSGLHNRNTNVQAANTSEETIPAFDGSGLGGVVGYMSETNGSNLTNTGTVSSTSGDYENVGGITGRMFEAMISDSWNSGNITTPTSDAGGGTFGIGGIAGNVSDESTIQTSYNTGNVAGYSAVGGIAGFGDFGIISNSFNSGNVTADFAVGGIGGYFEEGFVSNTYNIGTVSALGDGTSEGFLGAGGLVGGITNGTVSTSYNSGVVSAPNDETNTTGGLIGANLGATISESFWDTETSGQATSPGGGTGRTTAEMMNKDTFDDEGVSWDITSSLGFNSSPDETWFIFDGYTRPVLMMEYSTNIENPHQLQLVGTTLGANYTVANDIDLESALNNPADIWGGEAGTGFVPIGESGDGYGGSFDGQNYTISNLYINRPEDTFIGLFGFVEEGDVNNVRLENVDITGAGTIGGIAGYFIGNDETASIPSDLYVSGTVTGVNNAANIGGVLGYIADSDLQYVTNAANIILEGGNHQQIGGIAGQMNNVEGQALTNNGNITSTSNATAVGGIVGLASNEGGVERSYNSGSISVGANSELIGGIAGSLDETNIFESYSTGSITANNSQYVGGLAGFSLDGLIFNSYASGLMTTANSTDVGGILGDYQISGILITETPVVDSFWDVETTNQSSDNGGGRGITTSQSLSLATYEESDFFDWDINTELELNTVAEIRADNEGWFMIDGQTRPILIMEINSSISTPHQLQLMSALAGESFTLANDIDMSVVTNNSEVWGGSVGTGFVPVGNNETNFTGSFDGQGYTISNLSTNQTETNAGLFGNVSGSGYENSITNVRLVDADINLDAGTGGYYAGGIAGQVSGEYYIDNVSVSGSVSGSGNAGNGAVVGGLVGQLNEDAELTESHSSAVVSGTGNTGGLVGENAGLIEESYFDGSVSGTLLAGRNMGGLAGTNTYEIYDSYSIGSVTDLGSAGNVGGFVGSNAGGYIEYAYSSGAVSGGANRGGFVGNDSGSLDTVFWDTDSSNQSVGVGANLDDSPIAGCFNGTCANGGTENLSALATYSGDWDITSTPAASVEDRDATWFIFEGATRPVLWTNWTASISNAVELQLAGSVLSADYVLINDIDLANLSASESSVWGTSSANTIGAGFAPIGDSDNRFTGSFDGQNYTIDNLYLNVTETSQVNNGLFGVIDDGASVENVGLTNVNITVNYDPSEGGESGPSVGSLVGSNYGSINNVYATGEINAGGETLIAAIGGLAGTMYDEGAIHNSYSAVNLTSYGGTPTAHVIIMGGLVGGILGSSPSAGISNSYATGNVNNSQIVTALIDEVSLIGTGGLVGFTSQAAIRDSFATGNVNSGFMVGGLVGLVGDSLISNSYATGTVTGDAFVGGLVGAVSGSNISTSYSAGDVTSTLANLSGYDGEEIGIFGTGGLAGASLASTITNTYSIGAVTADATEGANGIGGLIGTVISGEVSDSYSTGNVTLNSEGGNVGGYIGSITSGATIRDGFWDVVTSTQSRGYGFYDDEANPDIRGGCFDGACGGEVNTANLSSLGTFDSEATTWSITSTASPDETLPSAAWFIFPGSSRPILMMENTSSVSNAHQLQMISARLGGDYTLQNDIDLAAPLANPADVWGGAATGFVPIGDYPTTAFSGTFDGNNNTINNLTIDSSNTSLGLFGLIDGGEISNLNLTNADINISYNGMDLGLAGVLAGVITSGTITNVSTSGTITATSDVETLALGGLIGATNLFSTDAMTISNSNSSVNITADHHVELQWVGGIIGLLRPDTTINSSYSTGNIVVGTVEESYEFFTPGTGGLVGVNFGEISNSYATGTVTGVYNIGGFAGDSSGDITSSYFTGSVDAETNVGGLVGFFGSGTINSSYNTGTVDGSENVGGLAGYGDGTIESESYNSGSVTGTENTGGLVGTGNAYIDSSYNTGVVTGGANTGGLVGYDDGGTEIEVSYNSGRVNGTTDTGGLVGYSNAEIYESYNSGDVIGSVNVGGLVGTNLGQIQDSSYNTGTVSGQIYTGGIAGVNEFEITSSFNLGEVTSNSYAGGIAGDNQSNITRSYNAGSITSLGQHAGGIAAISEGSIANVYNIGTIEANERAGGLVGTIVDEASVDNAYSSGLVRGNRYVGGIAGFNDNGGEGSGADFNGVFWDIGINGSVSSTTQGCGNLTTCTDIRAGVFSNPPNEGVWNLSDGDTFSTAGWSIGQVSSAFNGEGVPTWVIIDGSTRPFLSMEHSTQISNPHQLQLLGASNNSDYTIVNDIDMTSALNNESDIWGTIARNDQGHGFVPVENFNQDLDGGNYTINGLYIRNNGDFDYIGLFGDVSAPDEFLINPSISNVNITNATVISTTPTSDLYAGILAGSTEDYVINNVSVSGDIIARNVQGLYLGGMVGNNNDSEVSNVHSAVNVTGVTLNESYIGGLVGYQEGRVTNTSSTGDIAGYSNDPSAVYTGGLIGYSDSSISNASNTGDVVGQHNTGGLVGYSESDISNAYNIGSVTGKDYTGGIVGYADSGDISFSYSSGNVIGEENIGGLVGYLDGNVEDSYSTGSVSGTRNVGGLVGFNDGGSIINTYSSGAVSGNEYLGGLVGRDFGDIGSSFYDINTSGQNDQNGTGITTEEFLSLATFNDRGWSISANVNTGAGAPTGDWFIFAGSTRPMLTMEYNTTISTPHQLQLMGAALGADYTLASDIDMSRSFNNAASVWATNRNADEPGAGFNPVGVGADFSGSFDGQGYTISNLYMNSDAVRDSGLFASVSGNVTNARLVDIEYNVQGINVGAVAGVVNGGSVTDSYSTGSITLESNSNARVGGLVGNVDNDGSVARSYSLVDVSATENLTGFNIVGGLVGAVTDGSVSDSYSGGSVTATVSSIAPSNYAGGLVGENRGTITDTYSFATVNAVGISESNSYQAGGLVGMNHASGVINTSYSTGAVTATDSNVGGLVSGNNGTVNNSYWDTDTSLQASSAAGVGLTTNQALDVLNYNGFDISSETSASDSPADVKWFIFDGYTRPILMAEYSTDISNAHQLQLAATAYGADYNLANNIDLNAAFHNKADVWATDRNADQIGSGFVPIAITSEEGYYSGIFNGNNYTINNLFINSDYTQVGLFAGTQQAVVKNINIANANITASGTDESEVFVGILAGLVFDNTTIENVRTSGVVVADDTNNSAYIGGLAGTFEGDTLSRASSTADVYSYAYDDSRAGGLLGKLGRGEISETHATGNVVSNSASERNFVGGLIGETNNSTRVSTSYATGNVSGILTTSEEAPCEGLCPPSLDPANSVGGLIGRNFSEVTDTYSIGDVTGTENVGGLVGHNYDNIENSYSTGLVVGDSQFGGFVGRHEDNEGFGATITNSYYDVDTSGQSDEGDAVGLPTEVLLAFEPYSNWNITSEGYSDAEVASSTWFMFEGATRPILMMENTSEVSNAHQLQMMGARPGREYTLVNDIDLSSSLNNPKDVWAASEGGFIPIGDGSDKNFTGSFDGNNFTINNLAIESGQGFVGLFGRTDAAIIENLVLANVSIVGIERVYNEEEGEGEGGGEICEGPFCEGEGERGGELEGPGDLCEGPFCDEEDDRDEIPGGDIDTSAAYLGGLTGYQADGVIINVNVSGDVVGTDGENEAYIGGVIGYSDSSATIDSVTSSADVDAQTFAGSFVGGAVGYVNEGVLNNISASGNVSALVSDDGSIGGITGRMNEDAVLLFANFSGSVDGNRYVGGIVGHNTGRVFDSNNSGSVIGIEDVGGIAGYHTEGLISRVHNSGDVNGETNVGGLVGQIEEGALGNTTVDYYNTGTVTGDENIGGIAGLIGSDSEIGFGYNSGEVIGEINVGGIAGYNTSSGFVFQVNYGDVSGGDFVGGLVGYNIGYVAESYNAGYVSGETNVGGITGYNINTITDVYNIGRIEGTTNVGGISGFNSGEITYTYNSGSVNGTSNVGGVIGRLEFAEGGEGEGGEGEGGGEIIIELEIPCEGICPIGGGGEGDDRESGQASTYLEGNFWDTGTQVGENAATQGCGNGEGDCDGTASGVFNYNAFNEEFEGGEGGEGELEEVNYLNSSILYDDAGWDISDTVFDSDSTWVIFDGFTRPLLMSEARTKITNAHQLQLIGSEFADNNTKLGNDIDLTPSFSNTSDVWGTDISGEETVGLGFVSVETLVGNFDGQNNIIDNLYINSVGDFAGLFIEIPEGTQVSNLGLTNINLQQAANDLGGIGGLAGNSSGTISNSYTTGTIILSTEESEAIAGGLVGLLYGEDENQLGVVSDSYSSVNIVAAANGDGAAAVGGLVGAIFEYGYITDSYTTGDITVPGGIAIGGLAGWNYGEVNNSYSTGNVTGGTSVGGLVGEMEYTSEQAIVTNSYSSSAVVGVEGVGGLVGYLHTEGSNAPQIINSYSQGVVNGEDSVGGLVGIAESAEVIESYSTAATTGTSDVGGLVGTLLGSTVSDSYSTGHVIGVENLGGLVGTSIASTVENSFYDLQTSEQSDDVGKGAPRTTAQLMQQSTFTNWDFSGQWSIIEGVSYPFLDEFYQETPRVISGPLPEGIDDGSQITLLINGVPTSLATTGADGTYYFFTGNNTLTAGDESIADGTPLLIFLNDGTTSSNFVTVAPIDGASLANVELVDNQLTIGDDSLSGTVTNALLEAAKGSMSGSDILFDVVDGDLNVNGSIEIASGITYNLEGDLTATERVNVRGDFNLMTDATISGIDNVSFDNGSNINGAYNLTISSDNNALNLGATIGDNTALTSLVTHSDASTTIGANSITTTGDQTYNSGGLQFSANTAFTTDTGDISLHGGAMGPGQDISLTGNSGGNTFRLDGSTYNVNSITVNGTGTGNLLAADSGNALQTYDITGTNQGSLNNMSLNFNNIDNIDGAAGNNTFNFADGAVIEGTIDGMSLATVNTLNYDAYSTPLSVYLDTTNDGRVENSNGDVITNFLNISHTSNTDPTNSSTIELPVGKEGAVVVTGDGAGYINDPIFFVNFHTVTGAEGFANQLIFDTSATILSQNSTSVIALVNGVQMTFINFSAITGGAAAPEGAGGTGSGDGLNEFNNDVAQIVNQPEVNEENNDQNSAAQIQAAVDAQRSYGAPIINTISIKPLLPNYNVETGAACYRSSSY